MIIRQVAVFSLAVLLAAPGHGYTAAELEAQLDLLLEWWPGEYDNNEQIVRQSGGGLSTPRYTPHFRVHGHYKKVELPNIAEHVIYIEEYKNNDPSELYRIRLMSLAVDADYNGIRATLYAPGDQQALIGSHQNLEAIRQSDPDSWRKFSDGCAVFLEYQGGQFTGGMKARACRVATDRSQPDNKDGAFEYEIVVGPDYYWFRDKISRLSDDGVTWELAPGSPDFYQLDRATWFSCTVNFNLDGDMTATERLTTVRLHDQGGVAPVVFLTHVFARFF